MKPYTVVLLYPDYLADDNGVAPYGQEIYVAHVTAPSKYEAVPIAQSQAFERNVEDGQQPNCADDFALCVMFEGHHNPALFGWQL